MTEIDTKQILVIDNYFSQKVQEYIHDDLLEMRWGFKNSPYADFYTSRMFGINLFYNHSYSNDCPYVVKSITDEIINDVLSENNVFLYRILANMQGLYQYAEIHTDSSSNNFISLIYHVNNSEGDTCFYDSKDGNIVYSVPFKMGRMIVFPSHYWHQGLPPERFINPTDNFRISLGYCFETH